MKIVLLFTALLFVNNCVKNKVQSELVIQFKYEAITRGSSLTYVVNDEEIITSTKGSINNENSKEVSNKDWGTLVEYIKLVDLTAIENLVPPSDDSKSDKVRIATLTVTTANHSYKSEPFDEGNPPKELAPIIDKIIAIAKTVD
jgi:heat shock protein HslJ